MPKMTIYIRQADVDLWKELRDKSKKISELLNNGGLK